MELRPLKHACYIIQSTKYNRAYIGYTVNFSRRIRQHNGEIKGGAKRTKRWRPWKPVCIIRGFDDNSSALRFEYRLQRGRKKAGQHDVDFRLRQLERLIKNGDGSIKKNNKKPWPHLYIEWLEPGYTINHPGVTNHGIGLFQSSK